MIEFVKRQPWNKINNIMLMIIVLFGMYQGYKGNHVQAIETYLFVIALLLVSHHYAVVRRG